MISAGVLLRLHEEGLLDIDAPLIEITELAANHPGMTVAQLLSNSSGLPSDGLYEPYLCQYGGISLTDCTAAILTTPDDDADVIAPDTQFLCGGAQWQVAGGIAEIAAFGSRAWINADAGYAAYWVIEDSFLTSLMYEGDLRNLVHEAVTGDVLAEG